MILDYCHQLLDVLTKLEELLQSSDELKQNYERRVAREVEWQAIFLGFLISSILIVWFMTEKSGMFGRVAAKTGATEVFVRMFSISFVALVLGNGIRIGSQWLWMRDYFPLGKRMVKRLFLKKYQKKENEIINVTSLICGIPAMRIVINNKRLETSDEDDSLENIISLMEEFISYFNYS